MHLPEKEREKGTLQYQLFPGWMTLTGTGKAETRPQEMLWIYYTSLLYSAAEKNHIRVLLQQSTFPVG